MELPTKYRGMGPGGGGGVLHLPFVASCQHSLIPSPRGPGGEVSILGSGPSLLWGSILSFAPL